MKVLLIREPTHVLSYVITTKYKKYSKKPDSDICYLYSPDGDFNDCKTLYDLLYLLSDNDYFTSSNYINRNTPIVIST